MTRLIDTMQLGHDRVIGAYDIGGVVVDPGPASTVETLLAGVEPRVLLLTHIHLDHTGATGVLVRCNPDLKVYVHDIEKWNASLDLVVGWKPRRLGLTHFGFVDDVAAQTARTRARLDEWGPLARDLSTEEFAATVELPRVGDPNSGLGGAWRVIVLNDDHNTFDGVARTLARFIPGVSLDQGYAFADTIHNSGQAIVWSGQQETAELYWEQLHDAGLTMAPLEQG